MRLSADTNKERVDSFLARRHPENTRSYWQTACEFGNVRVNGQVAKASHKIHTGDIVEVTLPEKVDFSNDQLPVLYEDDDVIVINKPHGILTHAKGTINEEFSVAEFMRPRTSDNSGNRPGIVHRLDRATSGVIIAAKHDRAKKWLQKQFSTRKVKKTYLALVDGHLKEPAALIQLPIERNPKKPQSFRVGGNGKPAETAYETMRVYKHSTLLQLMPHTGRTHQLRVHLSYIGHPIVGDEFYSKPEPKLGRMFLHAAELEITLPSHQRKTFRAPLPKELQTYIDSLQ